MRVDEAAVPTFARHETFYPRYGWFRKAYAHALADPHIFSRAQAPVIIGVGKNMVRSIRFWGLAAKILVEDPHPTNPRQPGLIPTRFGHALLQPDGWDPYMEDPGSLWLLHWKLLSAPSRLPVWWLALNAFPAVEFSDSALVDAVLAQLEVTAAWPTPSESAVKKDVNALVRTYSPVPKSARSGIDDMLDGPLRELGLIQPSVANPGGYRFSVGPKPSLPSAIVLFAVLDHIARVGIVANTITLSRLASEPGSPGAAFKLSEVDLGVHLESACEQLSGVDLTRPAGASQLVLTRPAQALAVEVLGSYFERGTADHSDLLAGPDGDRPIDDDQLDLFGHGRDFSEREAELLYRSAVAVEAST